MKNQNGKYFIIASLILGFSVIIAASQVADELNSATTGIHNIAGTMNVPTENYELIVSDGWMYLYDQASGQIWKKLDNPDASWEMVKHFTEQ